MTTENIEAVVLLHDGTSVSGALYGQVRVQVEGILDALEHGERYTLEMLCGPEFWRGLSDGDRRTAGICMSDMVRNGILPLAVAKSKHEYPKWYRLK